jgi:hypothetical protein
MLVFELGGPVLCECPFIAIGGSVKLANIVGGLAERIV